MYICIPSALVFTHIICLYCKSIIIRILQMEKLYQRDEMTYPSSHTVSESKAGVRIH